MKYLSLLLLLIGLAPAFAQTLQRCGYEEVSLKYAQQHPDFLQHVQETFQQAKEHGRAYKTQEDQVYRIPVVFHIVYDTMQPEMNLGDSVIHSQIEVLNEDFRRKNADTGNTRTIFKSRAVDAGIEFFLAQVDPDGNPTTGITRTAASTFSAFDPDEVKFSSNGGKDAWPADKYLNIWITKSEWFAGFAYPPSCAPNWPEEYAETDTALQGVVLHYATVGRNNPYAVGQYADSDKGRTAVHEVGHYLGLRHIWGDSFFSDGCEVDDGIEDTPNAANASSGGCDFQKNECIDQFNDMPDMVENYMDYSGDACTNMFTAEQVAIMRGVLASCRSGLWEGQVSISSAQRAVAWQLYPNPASMNCYFQFHELLPEKVRVYNLLGREVKSVEPTESNFNMDISDMSAGVYLVSIMGEGYSDTRRLVVQ